MYKGSEKERIAMRLWRSRNRDKVAIHAKKSNLKNSDKIAKYQKEYRERNKEKLSLYHATWCKENLGKTRVYMRNKRKVNVQFRLAEILRTRQTKALEGNYKVGSFVRDLSCTISELKFYLEGKFKDGMSWDNYGHKTWHIDHEIPLAFFDVTNKEQFLKACHYTNLQPMWAKENLVKGNKVDLSLINKI